MIRIGLSSTALLSREARGFLRVAAAAGFDAVEWGSEAHAPGEDPKAADDLMIDTLRAGLTIASYAPLYRAGSDGGFNARFGAVLEAAARLQAPYIRIFAGQSRPAGRRRRPPAEDPGLEPLAAELRRLGDLAAERGRSLCICPCPDTWADSYEAASALAAAAGHPFVSLAWEPLPGASDEAASAALEAAGRGVRLIMARKLGRDGAAGRLADDEAHWRRRLAAFKAAESDSKMGSFVILGAARVGAEPGDDLPGLQEDLRFLKGLAAELEGPARRPGA